MALSIAAASGSARFQQQQRFSAAIPAAATVRRCGSGAGPDWSGVILITFLVRMTLLLVISEPKRKTLPDPMPDLR